MTASVFGEGEEVSGAPSVVVGLPQRIHAKFAAYDVLVWTFCMQCERPLPQPRWILRQSCVHRVSCLGTHASRRTLSQPRTEK